MEETKKRKKNVQEKKDFYEDEIQEKFKSTKKIKTNPGFYDNYLNLEYLDLYFASNKCIDVDKAFNGK